MELESHVQHRLAQSSSGLDPHIVGPVLPSNLQSHSDDPVCLEIDPFGERHNGYPPMTRVGYWARDIDDRRLGGRKLLP
jgi:hypothetical protein